MTVEDAIQQVVDALADANLTRGDAQPLSVTDFDPTPGNIDRPGQVSVTFGGMDPTEWLVVVRLYTDGTSDLKASEQFIRATVPALDAALDTVPSPRTAWQKSWSEQFASYVTETALAVPRDDF